MLNARLEDIEFESSNEKKLFYKHLAIRSGIFCGMLVVFFGLLVTFTLLGRKSWRSGLGNEIKKVFAENHIEGYEVGDYLRLSTSISVNCGVFSLVPVDPKKSEKAYCVIVRVPTLYGPVAAVYLYKDGRDSSDFVDFAQLNGPVSKAINSAALNSQISYWAEKVPAIIACVQEERNEKK